MLERALYAKQKSRSRHAGFSRFPRRRFAVLNPTCAENARQNASANLKKTTVVHEFLCPRKLRLAAQQMTTVGQTSFLSEETGWPQHLGSGDARSPRGGAPQYPWFLYPPGSLAPLREARHVRGHFELAERFRSVTVVTNPSTKCLLRNYGQTAKTRSLSP